MRVFISINIPSEVKLEIEKVQGRLPKFIGKKTESENLHLTLKFLGEIEENVVEDIRKRLRKVSFENFFVRFGEVGVFSPNFLRVIWLKVFGAEMLQEKIDEALEGLFEKEKRFMGHLTIGRIKRVGNKKEFLKSLSEIKANVGRFRVNGFELVKSELYDAGPEYEVIEEFKSL